jgi:CheY-like chemotaxis protein
MTAAVRLVALAGHGDEGTRRRARESGFDAFLTKPADPRALYEALA